MSVEDDAAQWMAEEVTREGVLPQSTAVWEIERRFGSDLVETNRNGNPAISKKVLTKFRKLTEGRVVWSRWDNCWQLLDKPAPPGSSRVVY
jgi:uncharacterized protein DUF6953